jgi:hypothetical protein
LDRLGQNQKKGFRHLNGVLNTALDKASEALEVAKSASGKADQASVKADAASAKSDEALAIAVGVRDSTAKEVSTLQTTVQEQGKQIKYLQQLIKQPGAVGGAIPAPSVQTKPMLPGDRLRKIKATFGELMGKTALMECSFVLGKKKDDPVDITAKAAEAMLAHFFPGMKIAVTHAPNAKTVRLHVDSMGDAKILSAAVETRWAEFGEKGWWMRADVPMELRALENRAREFIMAAKDSDPRRKTEIGYIAVSHGKILKDGREVIPLCFIPVQNGGNWQRLFGLFAQRVVSLKGQDWLGQFEDEDTNFYAEWFEKAGLQHLAKDCQAYAVSKRRPKPAAV